MCFEINMLPAVAYKTPGYSLDSLSESFVDCSEVPVTMILVTPVSRSSKVNISLAFDEKLKGRPN